MEDLRLEKYLTVKKFRLWDGFQMDYDPPVSLISTASVNYFFVTTGTGDVCMQYLGLDTNLKEIYELDELTFKIKESWKYGFVVDSEDGMKIIYKENGSNASIKISILSEYYLTGKNYYERK